MNDIDLQRLEQRIDALVRLCEKLAIENRALQDKYSDWMSERARLLEKNELARSKVEAMIGRLKSLEQNE